MWPARKTAIRLNVSVQLWLTELQQMPESSVHMFSTQSCFEPPRSPASTQVAGFCRPVPLMSIHQKGIRLFQKHLVTFFGNWFQDQSSLASHMYVAGFISPCEWLQPDETRKDFRAMATMTAPWDASDPHKSGFRRWRYRRIQRIRRRFQRYGQRGLESSLESTVIEFKKKWLLFLK